jgi:ArsR family transcriptional regulator
MKRKTTPTELGEEEARVAAELFKALAHPLRLQIVSVLSSGELHVNGLADHLGVPQAIVSQQLRILRSASLVASRTADGRALYRIVEPHLFNMLTCIDSCMATRTERGERRA